MRTKIQNMIEETRKTEKEAERLSNFRIIPEYYNGIAASMKSVRASLEKILDDANAHEEAMVEAMYAEKQKKDLELSVSPCLRGFVHAYKKTYTQ